MSLLIGSWILNTLKEKGMTQKQFAEELGFREAAVSEWKKGKTTPSIDQIVRMADYFSVTCDEIIRSIPAKEMNLHRMTGFSAETIARLKATRKSKPFANRFYDFFIKDQRSQLIWSALEKAILADIKSANSLERITMGKVDTVSIVDDQLLMPFEIGELLHLKASQVFPAILKDFCDMEVERYGKKSNS